MAKNIEKSREVRQWFNLFTRWISLGALVDCTVNEGKTIKSAGNWIKSKWNSLKDNFRR